MLFRGIQIGQGRCIDYRNTVRSSGVEKDVHELRVLSIREVGRGKKLVLYIDKVAGEGLQSRNAIVLDGTREDMGTEHSPSGGET